MPSSKTLVQHEQMFGGMNRGHRDHLVDPAQWRTSFGMRHFETQVRQIARKKELYSVLSNHTYPLSLLVNVPSGYENFGTLVGLTDSGAFRLSSTGASRMNAPDGSTKLLTADGLVRRFGHVLHNDRLFFVNPLNSVQVTDGSVVRTIENSPVGQYVEMYFEHLVVGRPNGLANRFQWSGLYDLSQWTPATHTEADHFDCVEHQNDGGYMGLTGLRRLGPLLCVYTASAIYIARYVGLPKVIVTDAVVQDFGSGLPWGLAAVGRSHFFIDMREKSFFRFEGAEVVEIGRPIKDFFFADLTTDQSLQLRTYTYIDSLYKEIHWVYVSTASAGDFDREVVFNYKANTWWTGPVENIWSFSPGTRRSRTIDELTGTINALTGTVDGLADATDVVGRVYGSRNGRLLRDETSSDLTAALLEQPVPYLETGDFHYADIENHKEVESMVIHSKYDDAASIDVFAAARTNIDDSVNLMQQSQTWTPTLPEQRLSMPRLAGRVFRFKFVPRANTASVVTETRTRGTAGFALLAQIPAIVEPPPPTVSLLFSDTLNSNPPSYAFSVTVPSGSNRGMFIWVHFAKQHHIDPTLDVQLFVDLVAATRVFFELDEDNSMIAALFWVANQSTGLVSVHFDNPASGGSFFAGRAHIAGVCLNGMHQTSPIINLQHSFNVLNNGFSFPSSTNHLVIPGLIVYSRAGSENVPLPTPYPGSGYDTVKVVRTSVVGPYFVQGAVALGVRQTSSITTCGWSMDPLCEGDEPDTSPPIKKFDWWNVAVSLRGV